MTLTDPKVCGGCPEIIEAGEDCPNYGNGVTHA